MRKIYIKIYFWTFVVSFLLINSEAFARVIRVSKCTIPFDFTIGSICVLGTLSLGVIGFLIMFGFGFIIELIKAVIRKIFKL